ncbi:hypothetical protein MP228_002944 [Amoeboaphelidium protococcarum]|nr:hypothetical protein MP228_002944 [Amoeboaphelidium protococcarum]
MSQIGNYYNLSRLINENGIQALRKLFGSKHQQQFVQSSLDQKKVVKAYAHNAAFMSSLRADQTAKIESGNAMLWDVSLLCLVLLQFPWKQKLTGDQLDAVKSIRDIRNALVHMSSLVVNDDSYKAHLATLTSALLKLGQTQADIDLSIQGQSSSQALFSQCSGEVQAQVKAGLEAMESFGFKDAIKVFSQIIDNGDLTDKDLAYILTQRGQAFIDVGRCDEAIKDGKRAAKLNPDFAQAFLVLGRAQMKKKEYDASIESYNMYLAINQQQDKDILHEKAVVQILKQQEQYGFHEESAATAVSMEEFQEEFQERFGFVPNLGVFRKGQREQLLSQAYEAFEVENDFHKAYRLYCQALKIKFCPEAAYKVAFCKYWGRGTKHDIWEAVRLFKQCAGENLNGRVGKKYGVADAQFALGVHYDHRIGSTRPVSEDMEDAIMWYKKAVDNGYSPAGFNLAQMYMNGQGVPKDQDKAMQLLQFSARLDYPQAVHALAHLSLEQGKFDDAMMYHKKAVALMFVPAITEAKSFMNRCRDMKKKVTSTDVETLNKLTSILRESSLNSSGAGLEKMSKVADFQYHPDKLNEYAMKGSEFGKFLLESSLFFWDAATIVFNHKNVKDISMSQKEEITENLYQCFIRTEIVATFFGDLKKKFSEILLEVLTKSKSLEFQGKAAVCNVVFNFTDVARTLSMCTRYIAKYPAEGGKLYGQRAVLNFLSGKYEIALRDANKACELVGEDSFSCVFDQFSCMRAVDGIPMSSYVEKAELFLKLAPYDHRKSPEVCYNLALLYLDKEGDRESARKWYLKGQVLEKRLLQIFLPYESTAKSTLDLMHDLKGGSSSSKAKKQVNGQNGSQSAGQSTSAASPSNTQPAERPLGIVNKQIFKKFRDHLSVVVKISGKVYKTDFSFKAPQNENRAISKSNLKEVALREMSFNRDQVMKGCRLSATILDVNNVHTPSLPVMIVDQNGDLCLITCYNVPDQQRNRFKIGAQIVINEPFCRMFADGQTGIRVDDPSSIDFIGQVQVCCCCGIELKAVKQCSKCKMATYCSRDCQLMDWKELKHNELCSLYSRIY